MGSRRQLIHTLFVLALPIVVAAFGWSWPTAVLWVLIALIWRWALAVVGIQKPEHGETIILESISASHFVEKTRWCLDRLGVDYREKPSGGIIGVLFTGRTVPRLSFRSGVVRSSIGNSAEILRFLWGHYSVSHAESARFLEPTEARLELERRLDKYGAHLQVWVYYHLLQHRELSVRVWGIDDPNVPGWQRLLLRPMFPVYAAFLKKVFHITDEHYQKAFGRIKELLADIETQLADGRKNLFDEPESNFVDVTFAALSGLWLMPSQYGGGRATSCLVARNRLPGPMQDDIEQLMEEHPRATELIQRLYAEERL